MKKKSDIVDFLRKDFARDLLKTIDFLNPPHLPISRLCTIKDVSLNMPLGLKETWKLIDEACECGLVATYGGLLSNKRVDLTELGELVTECGSEDDIIRLLFGHMNEGGKK